MVGGRFASHTRRQKAGADAERVALLTDEAVDTSNITPPWASKPKRTRTA